MSGIWSGLPLEASAGAAPAHLPQQKLLNLRRLTSGDYPDDSYKKGEVVVTLDDPSQGNLQKLLADFPDLIDDTPGGVVAAAEDSGRPAAVRLRLSQGTDELQAAAQLLRSPLVKLAEPNIIFQADTINPNDYRYSQQWNLGDSNGIRADQAWDLQKGSAALTLAVIDTGVDYNHEDLRDRCVGGYDFYNGDSDPWDDNGHGTSVSGIACASTNNHIGMAGIDWNAKIMPLKALGSNGEGGLDGVVNALYWAGQHSADVINMSFTSPTYSAELEDAIEYAHSRGCVMVAAAGNEGTSRIDYPAGLTYVIGVGSTGPTGVRSSFSNYNSSVDLVAPGETILGPYPGNRYLTGSGTSEASPHVAGAALLVKAEYPGSGPDEIWRRLKDGARPGGAGYDEQYGWGLLDAEASLKVPLVGITSPSDFSYPASGMVSAIATDTPVNVQYGELWVDGQLCDSASVAPGPSVSFTFSAWDLNQLGEGTHTITVRARDSGSQWRGEQSITVYRNHSQPRPAHDWYLAEGTTSWGFEEYVLVQNPNSAPAQVHVRFMKPGGSTQDCDFSMMPASRLTINVNSLVPSGDVSTYVHSSDQEIIAERSMYWGNRTGGHDAAGVNNPGTDWYMAEGSTNWGFEEYVLVQNPNAVGASIHVTFMEQGGTTREFDFAMAGCSRLTLPVNDLVPGSDIATHVHSDQPVIAERSMYWNNRDGGHCATAVSEGSRTWYLAEGSTAWNFEEYLLVQNPNSTAANVDFDFMKPSGSEVHKSFSLAPFSRFTLNVAQAVPGSDVSAFVSADQPVIAERAMYWPKGSRSRAEGHDSTGSVSAATTWYLAEGSTAWGFDEWILLLNPTDDVAHAVLDYMRTDGSSVVQQVKVVAHARYTVHCNDFDPNRDVSVRLTSDFPLVVERSMYWQDKEGGTNALGVLQP
jgi:subtilisin family serine protease